MFLYKDHFFGLVGLQVFSPFALPVFMPAAYHVIRATGIETVVRAADYVNKPCFHFLPQIFNGTRIPQR